MVVCLGVAQDASWSHETEAKTHNCASFETRHLPGTDEVVSEVFAEAAGSGIDAHAIWAGAVFAAVPRGSGVHPGIEFAELSPVSAFVGNIVGGNFRFKAARAELALGDAEHSRGRGEVDGVSVRVRTHGCVRCGVFGAVGEGRASGAAEARAQRLERVRQRGKRRGHRGPVGRVGWRGIHDERQ